MVGRGVLLAEGRQQELIDVFHVQGSMTWRPRPTFFPGGAGVFPLLGETSAISLVVIMGHYGAYEACSQGAVSPLTQYHILGFLGPISPLSAVK